MKIAVPTENGMVFQHFGHTEAFTLADIQNGTVLSTTIVSTNGNGHGALAGFLRRQGVQVLICGGIGAGAVEALQHAGISIYAGVQGSVPAALEGFLNGSVLPNAQPNCHHHEQPGAAHSCGGHSCGSCSH